MRVSGNFRKPRVANLDIFIVLDTLADQLDTTKRFGDHTVTFISEYKKQVTKRHKCV